MRYLAILLCLLLVGCGHWKTKKQATEVEVKKATESTTTTKADVKTVITETATGNIVVPGNTITVAKPVDEVLAGRPLVAEQDGTKVAVTYDPTTGTIHALATTAPKTVPVNIDKRTEITDNTQSTTKAKTDEKAEVNTLDVYRDTNTTTGGFALGMWAALLLIVGVLVLVLWVKTRRII